MNTAHTKVRFLIFQHLHFPAWRYYVAKPETSGVPIEALCLDGFRVVAEGIAIELPLPEQNEAPAAVA
jgi:hypothetical protein